MQILLIKGSSAYDALHVFIDELAAAFAERGYSPTVIVADADLAAVLARVRAQGPTALVFTFNILSDYRDMAGRSIGEMVGAPHVLQFVDHPFTHLARLEATSAATAVLTVDPSHVDAIRTVYGPGRFRHVAFSPHAAVGPTVSPGANAPVFGSERDIPILFAGTFYKPDPARLDAIKGPARKIFDAAIDIALAEEFMPALQAMDTATAALGLDPGAPQFSALRRNLSVVHEHVRTHRRFLLLKTAAKLGLPMHVYGSGYERDAYRFKGLTLGGGANLRDILSLMGKSRVVLNINANFGAGSHERPLSAMKAGAAAASDFSHFYAGAFEEGREIALYRWLNLESDLAAVGALAMDPDRAFDLAERGQAKVLANHSWAARVDGILGAADAVRDYG